MSTGNAIRAGRAFIELFLNETKFERQLKLVQERVRQMANRMKSISFGAFGLGAAMTAPLAKAVMLASSAQEAANRFQQTFTETANEAERFSQVFAQLANRDVQDIREGLQSITSILKASGNLTERQAFAYGKLLTKIGVDLSSFQDISQFEAFERLRSMLAGSVQVMDIFGVNVRESAVALKLQQLGFGDNVRTAEMWQKQIARILVAHEQLTNRGVMGDAIRTADQFANVLKGLFADVKQFARAIGEPLLKPLEKVGGVLSAVIGLVTHWVQTNPGLALTVAKVTAAVLFFAAATGSLALALGALSMALTVLSSPAGIAAAILTIVGLMIDWERHIKGVEQELRGLVKAVNLQEWQLAFAQIELVFLRFMHNLAVQWDEMILGMRQALVDMLPTAMERSLRPFREFLKGDPEWYRRRWFQLKPLNAEETERRRRLNNLAELGLDAAQAQLDAQLARIEALRKAELEGELPQLGPGGGRGLDASSLPRTALTGTQDFFRFLRNDIPRQQLNEQKKTNQMLERVLELAKELNQPVPVQIP